MVPHSSVLAWRIPGTGGPGGLLSMGSHRVGIWGKQVNLKTLKSLNSESVTFTYLSMYGIKSKDKYKFKNQLIYIEESILSNGFTINFLLILLAFIYSTINLQTL